MKLRFKRKGKTQVIDEKHLGNIMEHELSSYVKREDLTGYLQNIERDRKRKELWDSMPAYKKIKVLRYVLERKGDQHGKK